MTSLIEGITRSKRPSEWLDEHSELDSIDGNINTPKFWNEQWKKAGSKDRIDPERLKELTRLSEGAVIDAGCALGHLCNFHYQRGCEPVYGVDVSREAILKAKRNYPFCQFLVASAEALPFRASSFDTYSTAETLEHLTDYFAALVDAERVVKLGGLVVFAVPHSSVYHEHMWIFTEEGVKNLVGSRGHVYEYTYALGGRYLLGWYRNDKTLETKR